MAVSSHFTSDLLKVGHGQVSGVEVDSQLSISCGIHREDEVNFENLVVEDTPTRLSTCDEGKEEQFQAEKLMVEDYFTNLSMSEKGGREDVLKTKELIVVETPPKLRSDDVRFYLLYIYVLSVYSMYVHNGSSHKKITFFD